MLIIDFSLHAYIYVTQSVPVYLSEMAPAKIRGALNIGFQMAITIGILVAQLVNYGTAKIQGGWGWRLSLALAAVPAIMLTIGSIFLPDTPNSILERGHTEKARRMLQKIRGTDNVDEEFQDLMDATKAAKKVEHPWRNILQPRYRPQLIMCTLIPFFQQITGINVIMFYAPVLFMTLGFGQNASLMSAVITGTVNVVATLVSIYSVDRFGRRALFLEGGMQMIVCQVHNSLTEFKEKKEKRKKEKIRLDVRSLLVTCYNPKRSYISLDPSFAQITKNLFTNLFLEILNLLLIFYYSDLRLLLAS